MKDILNHLFILIAFIVLLIISIFLLLKFPNRTSYHPSLTTVDYWWKKFSVWSLEDEEDDTEYEVIVEEKSGKRILREKPKEEKEEKEEKPPIKKEEHYRTFSYCDISFINSLCCTQMAAGNFDQIA